MPVLNNYNIVECHGNDSGRVYNFPFRCYSLDHLVVEYVDQDGNATILAQNVDYSVCDGLDNAGGSVTYPLDLSIPSMAANETLRISRRTPLEQSTEFPVYQQVIENALDKELMLLQEMQAAISSASNILIDTQQALQLSTSAMNTASTAEIKSSDALAVVNQALDTVNKSEAKIDLVVEFIGSVANKLDIETGTEDFYTVAGNLESKVVELTARVEELTMALDDKVDKDPIIQLITSTGEVITDINDNIIHIPFRKEAHA